MFIANTIETRIADQLTIKEAGLPGIVLMENAAQGASRILTNTIRKTTKLNLAAFCGQGNNGGDGLAICRILTTQGALCTAYLFCESKLIKDDALTNLKVAIAYGVKIVEIPNENTFNKYLDDMTNHNFYLDALLGTGLKAPVQGIYAKAINFLNNLDQPILAVDIPSGLNADTGISLGNTVRANLTTTFGLMKAGLILDPGEHVGELTLINIGISPAIIKKLKINRQLITANQALIHLNKRILGGHKGSFGHLLTIGGSIGFSGAACLMAMSGIRAGAGLVTLAIPEGLNQIAETKLTAVMTHPLPQTNDGTIAFKALPILLELEHKCSALAVGPGLKSTTETKILIRKLLAQISSPIIIDADGLNTLADKFLSTYIAAKEVIITPHHGEAARLLNCSITKIQADPISTAQYLAKTSNTIVVLKGARTVIASPVGKIWINPTGNQLLASGGSGDVLTGLIGGLLAQKLTAIEAALVGVYIHGLAAEQAKINFGPRGLAAEELLDYLPSAFAALEKI